MKSSKAKIIFLTFILLTLGNSKFLINVGINSYVELIGYILLAIEIWFYALKEMPKKGLLSLFKIFSVLLILFSIGICLQPLKLFIKLRLLFTMFMMATITVPSKKYLNSLNGVRMASYGVLIGIFGAILLSIIGNVPLSEISHEGFLNFGFNGGLQYKNYYAATLLASFMGIYTYHKYEKKNRLDTLIMILQVMLLLLSSSRGGYLLFILFFILINFDWIVQLYHRIDKNSFVTKHKWQLIVFVIVLFIVGCFGASKLICNSATYMYRVRGVQNYISFYKNDWFHLLFGNAQMAFGNPDIPYVTAIRIAINGFDGSYEMGFINVLVKNGIIGILGYIWVYIMIIQSTKKMRENKYKIPVIAVLTVLLFSSLVESYVCSLHGIFGVYCYLFMLGICGIDATNPNNKKEQNKKIVLVDECIDRVGGVERVICTLANSLSEKYDVTVISEYKLNETPFYEYNSNVKIQYLMNNTKQKSSTLKNKNLKYYFYRSFEKLKSKILLKQRIKKITYHSNEMSHASVIIFGRVYMALHFLPFLNKRENCKIIVRDAIHLKYYSKKIQEQILTYFPNKVDEFIVSSDESIKAYQEFFKEKSVNMKKIYNPLGIIPNIEYHFANKKIISIGRLDEQKGFETLIRAMAQVHNKYEDWSLEIYGSGTYEKKLQDEIEKQKAEEYIKILPAVHDVVSVFNQSSIFVLPSRYEGYANVLVEAMSCGIPCISFDWLMGADEIIEDGENGILVHLVDREGYFNGLNYAQDAMSLAEKIAFLIESPTVCDEMSKKATQIVNERSINVIVQKWTSMILDTYEK